MLPFQRVRATTSSGDRGASAVEYGLIIGGIVLVAAGSIIALSKSMGTAFKAQTANVAASPTAAGAGLKTPVAPTNLTVTPGPSSLILTWNPVPNATAYIVYGCGSATYTTTSTSYTCTGLTNGQAYNISVSAVNSGGEGPASGTVSGTPQLPTPSTPTGVTTTLVAPGQVQVTWTKVTGASTYTVYCGSATITTAGTSATCTGLTVGTPVVIQVTATGDGTNTSGTSPKSVPVTVTPVGAPPAPTNVGATAGNGQITITWNPVTGVANYTVKCGTKTITVTTTNYTCTGLTNGTQYSTSVVANGDGSATVGASPPSTVVKVVPLGTNQFNFAPPVGTTPVKATPTLSQTPVNTPTATFVSGTGGCTGTATYTGGQVVFTPTSGRCGTGDSATVSVTYRYNPGNRTATDSVVFFFNNP